LNDSKNKSLIVFRTCSDGGLQFLGCLEEKANINILLVNFETSTESRIRTSLRLAGSVIGNLYGVNVNLSKSQQVSEQVLQY